MHTRISEELDESLRRAAEDLRVPVSNLVRNVLEDALDVVEVVTENVGDLVEDVVEEAREIGNRFEDRWGDRLRDTRRRARDAGERARESGRAARDAAEVAREVGEKARVAAQRVVEAFREEEDDAPVHDTESSRAPEGLDFPDIAGWQPLVLNAAQECAGCGRQLFRGDASYLGLGTSASVKPTYLCEHCLDSLS